MSEKVFGKELVMIFDVPEKQGKFVASEPGKRVGWTQYGADPLRSHPDEFIAGRMRDDDTPISVAFADPILRAAGMENDSYGEAKRFFELSDGELHELVCFCHFGERVSAATVARRVRKMADPQPSGFFAQLRAFFG